MSSMSSVIKNKNPTNLNIFTMNKNKASNSQPNKKLSDYSNINRASDAITKNSLHLKDLKQNKEINQLLESNKETVKEIKESNANSFRQSGIVNMKKFKTTKCSRINFIKSAEKNLLDKNTSLESKDLKNPTGKIGITFDQNLKINEDRKEDDLDVIAKKLKTSNSKGKLGINLLNSTNPSSVHTSQIKNFIIGKMNPLYPKDSSGLKLKIADVSVSQSISIKEKTNSK